MNFVTRSFINEAVNISWGVKIQNSKKLPETLVNLNSYSFIQHFTTLADKTEIQGGNV